MSLRWILFSTFLALSLCACSNRHDKAVANSKTSNQFKAVPYTLQAGDQLVIDVYGQSDLSRSITVPPDGVVVYPLIGKLVLGGRNIVAIKDELTERLGESYLVEPQVTIQIKDFVKKDLIYVLGEVKNPGSYQYENELTVFKAISMAGGFTDKANTKQFERNRTLANGNQSKMSVKRGDTLLPGDVVIVPISIW